VRRYNLDEDRQRWLRLIADYGLHGIELQALMVNENVVLLELYICITTVLVIRAMEVIITAYISSIFHTSLLEVVARHVTDATPRTRNAHHQTAKSSFKVEVNFPKRSLVLLDRSFNFITNTHILQPRETIAESINGHLA
jgi:hypothetical protein